MMKIQLLLIFVCAQIFLINCYTINHIQRPLWTDFEGEPTEELLSKILHNEALFNEANPPIASPAVGLFDQADSHSRSFQKRGRQCLWKVCSWALDKRSLRPSSSPTSNSVDTLSKLLY